MHMKTRYILLQYYLQTCCQLLAKELTEKLELFPIYEKAVLSKNWGVVRDRLKSYRNQKW